MPTLGRRYVFLGGAGGRRRAWPHRCVADAAAHGWVERLGNSLVGGTPAPGRTGVFPRHLLPIAWLTPHRPQLLSTTLACLPVLLSCCAPLFPPLSANVFPPPLFLPPISAPVTLPAGSSPSPCPHSLPPLLAPILPPLPLPLF